MRGGKRPSVPEGALFFLGNKPKKSLLSSSNAGPGSAGKKAKGDFIEVEPAELVSRTEAALNSNNVNLAESLVLSALNQLRASSGPTPSAALAMGGVGFRSVAGSSSGSRLPAGFSIGLLILAQAHPTLFTRVAVLDQLISLLSLSPRELGISLPPAAVATICARARGLHIYLEDSLMDRVWVDQDECRAFVLNLETAFPKVYGDPRGLFTVLCGSGSSAASTAQSSGSNAGSNSSGGSGSTAVHTVLGLVPGQSNTVSEANMDGTGKDEIAEAVTAALKASSTPMAKVIHATDPVNIVLPRFENSRQAVEVMIVNTLREALGRRGPGSGPTTTGGASSSGTGSSTAGTQSTTTGVGSGLSLVSGSGQGVSPSVGSTEVSQLRSLIRTVAMACGLPEVRGLVATRLEPWITVGFLFELVVPTFLSILFPLLLSFIEYISIVEVLPQSTLQTEQQSGEQTRFQRFVFMPIHLNIYTTNCE
ncbi:unnamed protein product [Echinostoma caproni]|uniref:Symplekin_C domain-containing protein n=1 Tax=Echinostoma caproni TaxID=27848 RepID=A0A183B6G3_9TREM|nr:unnamed protein product [Echinostoma caproni]